MAMPLGGCVLVMDTDFGKYEARADEPGAGGGGGQQDGGRVDDATDGPSLDTGANAEGATANCSDGQQNQSEEGIDCGGPCPACAIATFVHREDFNAFPQFGPDGNYGVGGICNDNPSVAGWMVTNVASPDFTRASGFYAVINTDKMGYVGLACDDALFTPELPTRDATELTIEFDTSFRIVSAARASVVLVREGVGEEIWTRNYDGVNQHVKVGPVPVQGASNIRVLFRYEGEWEYFWMVDNVVITGT